MSLAARQWDGQRRARGKWQGAVLLDYRMKPATLSPLTRGIISEYVKDMVERDGWKPRNKEAAFNAGNQGGAGSPPGGEEQRGITWEEVRRILRARMGITKIENINSILSRDFKDGEFLTLSDEDIAKTEYYKFNIAVSLIGVNPLELPGVSEEDKEAAKFTYSKGASLVAQEYLQDDPDNSVARRIWNEGADAPIEVHKSFFKVVDANVHRFVLKHNR